MSGHEVVNLCAKRVLDAVLLGTFLTFSSGELTILVVVAAELPVKVGADQLGHVRRQQLRHVGILAGEDGRSAARRVLLDTRL